MINRSYSVLFITPLYFNITKYFTVFRRENNKKSYTNHFKLIIINYISIYAQTKYNPPRNDRVDSLLRQILEALSVEWRNTTPRFDTRAKKSNYKLNYLPKCHTS